MANVPKGFFSVLAEMLAGSKQKAMPAEQWAAFLKPGRETMVGGQRFPLRKDELDWSGLPEYLASMPGQRLELQQLQERLGERTLPSFGRNMRPEYADYILPGPRAGDTGKLKPKPEVYGEAYTHWYPHEGVGELPPAHQARADSLARMYKNEGHWFHEPEPLPFGVNDPLSISWHQARPIPTLYEAPHFNNQRGHSENLLAHSRWTKRLSHDKKPVHLVEELQSDWHQAGRESGYLGPEDAGKLTLVAARREMDEVGQRIAQLEAAGRRVPRELESRFDDLLLATDGHGTVGDITDKVPLAPFKDTWHELELKKNLAKAVADDAEYLALTTGQQQAHRYNLQGDEAAGMAHTYDNVYRGYLEKLARQFGGETTTIRTDRLTPLERRAYESTRRSVENPLPDSEIYNEVPAIRLTPALKERIRASGLPLFSTPAAAVAGLTGYAGLMAPPEDDPNLPPI